jgi:hypothetical protein
VSLCALPLLQLTRITYLLEKLATSPQRSFDRSMVIAVVPAGYVFLASLLIAMAIVIRLLLRYDTKWAGENLQRPDLRSLCEIADGRRFGVGRDRLLRLSKRGFTVEDSWGGCRVTMKGRYAVLLVRARVTFFRDADPTNGPLQRN